MKHPYQLLATDLDGTLLTSDKSITPRTADAIRQAIAQGKQIVFCSGRGLNEITIHADAFPGLQYIISANGAQVYDCLRKTSLIRRPIPHEVVEKIAAYEPEADFFFHSYTETWSISESRCLPHIRDYYAGQYEWLIRSTSRPTENALQYCAAHPEYPLFKIDLFHRSHEARMRTKTLFESWNLPVSITLCDESSIEITVQGADKGWALRQLCKTLSIPKEQVIYAGDSWNDLSGMEAAGLAVAVANAVPDTLSYADHITADNNHDGVGIAIEEFLLK